jgi:hypothetical protein
MTIRVRILRVLLPVLAIPACSGNNREIAEVEGTVLWHKKPLANAQIEFHPDNLRGTNGPRSTDMTDEHGRYTLYFDDNQPGAIVGQHRVILIEADQSTRGGKGRQRAAAEHKKAPSGPTIDSRYAKIATTPLTREVVSGKQTINFDLP